MEPNLDWTGVVAERKIQEAMEAGEFDNLPGRGQPLDLDVNPFESPTQRVVNRLLKNAQALPEWMQIERDIDRETREVGEARARALRAVQHTKNPDSRRRIVARVRDETWERLDLLNTMILKYNFVAPQSARRVFASYNLLRALADFDAAFAPYLQP